MAAKQKMPLTEINRRYRKGADLNKLYKRFKAGTFRRSLVNYCLCGGKIYVYENNQICRVIGRQCDKCGARR